MKETLDEYKVIFRFLYFIIDWDETAPREIIDKNAKIPNDWLENGKKKLRIFFYLLSIHFLEPLLVPDPDAKKPEEW